VNSAVGWVLLVLGLATVVVRRRSVALTLVTAQSLLLAAAALVHAPGRSAPFLAAALALLAKAAVIGFGLGWSLRRTREARPIAERYAAPTRGLLAAGCAILAVAVLPVPTVGNLAVERGAVALVVIGLATVVVRRATLFQALGLLVAENGVAFAATGLAHGIPTVIDLGVLFDLFVVIATAIAFHEQIFRVFGTGDTRLLGELRD